MLDKILIRSDTKEVNIRHQGSSSRYIVSFTPSKEYNTIHVEEECENYFKNDLNKKEFQKLIDALQNLADMMPDETIDDEKENKCLVK